MAKPSAPKPMNLIRKTPRIHLLVFHDHYDRNWCQEILQTGLPIVLTPVNGKVPEYDRNQILLYLDPDYEQFHSRAGAVYQLLQQGYKRQIIFSCDKRWKQVYENGNPLVVPCGLHPLELARLIVEKTIQPHTRTQA